MSQPAGRNPHLDEVNAEIREIRQIATSDAEFRSALAQMRRRAEGQIYAAYGQAMTAYRPAWLELGTNHASTTRSFHARERTVIGRFANTLSTMPYDSIGNAHRHIRIGLNSKEYRISALEQKQAEERSDLRIRQHQYAEVIARPYRAIVDHIAKELRHEFKDSPTPAPVPAQLPSPASDRKNAVQEMVKSLNPENYPKNESRFKQGRITPSRPRITNTNDHDHDPD